MAHVIVTGASGFVGRQVLKALKAAGHTVSVTLRPGRALPEGHAADHVIETPDLFSESAAWWRDRLAGADALVHAAWYVEPGKYLDSPKNLDCVRGTLALAEGAVAAGLPHLIGIGTCMEYRLPGEHLDVSHPLEADTLYAASKLSLFQMLTHYLGPTSTRFTWCRLFYLFGEGEYPARLVPYVRAQLEKGEVVKLSAGTQLRDFLDVAEAGRQIATTVDTGQEGPVNICSGKAITIRALVEGIADEYGRRDLLEFGTAAIHPKDPLAVVGVPNLLPAKPGAAV
jgi:dTDP-6-deoxy-L-talose 4-dehydrogenase (NAD+)